MPDGSNIYAGVAGYFGKPDHTGKAGVFQRAAGNARRHRRAAVPRVVQLGFVLAQIFLNGGFDIARRRLELGFHAP